MRPVVIADDAESAGRLDDALNVAVSRRGIGDTYINPALWLDDADIIAAAADAGCPVVTP